MVGLHAAFYISAVMCLIAAVVSLMRGKRYIHGADEPQEAEIAQAQ